MVPPVTAPELSKRKRAAKRRPFLFLVPLYLGTYLTSPWR